MSFFIENANKWRMIPRSSERVLEADLNSDLARVTVTSAECVRVCLPETEIKAFVNHVIKLRPHPGATETRARG